MSQWIDDAREVLQKRRHMQEARLGLAALSQKIEENRAALTALVKDLGEAIDPVLPVDALHRQARAALERLDAGWSAAQGVAARIESARFEVARARRQQDIARSKLQLARADWPEASGAARASRKRFFVGG